MRLKELFGNTARDRDAHANENRKLRELLAAHGISYDFPTPSTSFSGMPNSYDGSTSTGSVSGSYHQDSSTGVGGSPLNAQHSSHRPMQAMSAAQLPVGRLDYDQMGIDFVLTYDSSGRPVRPAYPSPPPGQ